METFVLPSSLYGEIHPVENPHAVILFCHGLGEHFGRYDVLINYFNKAGFVCAGSDHIGHGKSPGKRGDASSYDLFLNEIDDLKAQVKSRYKELPIVLYGHSMGGNIVLNYLSRRPTDDITAAVVSSPWITLPAKVPTAKQLLADIMYHIYPSFTAPNGLDPSGVSHDPVIVENYVNDPLVHDKISVRLFKAMYEHGEKLLEGTEVLDTPTLLIHGTADPMTAHKGSKVFAQQNKLVEFVAFPDMYHELHHEIIRNEVLEKVGKWLNSHLRHSTT